jgi:hypothetical protein
VIRISNQTPIHGKTKLEQETVMGVLQNRTGNSNEL